MHQLLNKRQYNRFSFEQPVKATMTLATLPAGSGSVSEGEFTIYVLDLSAGGLWMISKCNLEVNFLTIYKIPLEVEEKKILLYGKVVRKRKLSDGYYDYGISFSHFFNYEGGFVNG
ncbi:PilZ domain-containing protein [Bacillus sp. B-jedd]|uniref:PilZ domain-containing protein n=1 Tax=Bacillus sp. B-jedd TaxID=1476857 RepID=UPI001E4B5BA3|nr:PilZ domain-containing protein [Bacillus sp. B-jedd]